MWTRKELKTNAKVHFKANYWPSVLAALLITILTAGAATAAKSDSSSVNLAAMAQEAGVSVNMLVGFLLGFLGVALIISVLIKLLLINPLKVGATGLFIGNANGEKPSAKSIFGIFKSHYAHVGVTMFLKDLVICLWGLLLVIPGIIKALEYSMVDFILAEDPSTSWSDAKKLSSQMTKGHKWSIFVLQLSFIGWVILGIFTCGILHILYVNPYINQTYAELYNTLKAQ